MPLSIGTRLGPYEILAAIGAGGMGEVYRARDTKLGRDVAIKILPQAFASDPERLARFEREARALASFSHPNIGAIYGIEESADDQGVRHKALVLELIEGETLAERLARGRLAIDEVLHVSGQIANALEAAHEKGIVHRDLKPANIKITPGGVVKVLDFGLAKTAVRPGEASHLSTVVSDGTRDGTVLGTAAYMSPEQARGLAVDKRTDIWAFGCVLYEMLACRAAFGGTTATDTFAGIIEREPDWTALPQDTPARWRELLASCLVKDQRRRLRDIGDARFSLEVSVPPGVTEASRPATRPWSNATRQAVAAATLLMVAASIAIGWLLRRPPAAGVVSPGQIRLSLPPPAGFLFTQDSERVSFALSPDGTQLAFVTSGQGATRIWLRLLSASTAHPVTGTEGARSVFWSPDSTAMAFFAGDKLKRIDVKGGVPVTICDVPAGIGLYGSWSSGNEIVYASVEGDAIYRVPIAGGTPVVVVTRDRARSETRVNWPWFLPDGKRILFITRLDDEPSQLTVGGDGQPPRRVAPMHSTVQWVEPGYLVFARDGTLVAQRFDLAAERLVGEPIPIADPVEYLYQTAKAGFTASRNGILAYRSDLDVHRLLWFDRAGKELGSIGAPGKYQLGSISRDGNSVAFDRSDPRSGAQDLWVFDLKRTVETRITSAPSSDAFPKWIGDHALVFVAAPSGPPHLFRKDLASGETRELTPVSALQTATDVTTDDSTLAYNQRTPRGNFDIWTLSLSGPAAPKPFLSSPFNEVDLRFSPDGRAAAWTSDESGRQELYVAPRSTPGSRTRVSPDGAGVPVWSRSGEELFYLTPDGRLMTVTIKTTPSLSIGTPALLFTIKGKGWQSFDVAPDGRFLAVVPQIFAGEQPLNVVLNWTATLPR
jgi:serine/threonine protein kinase